MLKYRRLVVPMLLAVMMLVVLLSCGKSGTLNPNIPPTIRITSFKGDALDSQEDVDSLITSNIGQDTVLFQQKIYWSAEDVDGIASRFAFRVLNKNWDPIVVPCYDTLSTVGFETQGQWYLHFKDGASINDPDHPLGDPAVSTVWSDQVFAVINFPAADDVTHDSLNVPSIFEVKCIDDRNAESNIARKYFFTYSVRPTVSISSTKGDPEGKVVGTGVRFEFFMTDEDPFIVSPPDYFEYKVAKYEVGSETIIAGTETEWFTTANTSNISRVLLVGITDDSPEDQYHLLTTDYDTNGTQISRTRVTVRGYDKAGIVSEEDYTTFSVKEGFHPGTLLYNKRIYVLGERNFMPFQDAEIEIPNKPTSEGYIFATNFFKDSYGTFSALWSQDLSITLNWGYHGEYERDNPDNKKESVVFNEGDSTNYYTEIQAFDIRLDGSPDLFPPLHSDNENIIKDDDDGVWLRVPFGHEISQNLVLTNLEANAAFDTLDFHLFEVRAVD
ncbi:MAG: hypothetical protein K8S56_04235, partial [Candidatus Cloacimonetes bacterium]|nr:hypothetical protein [Candidatus Cloacimonadota bacterium]